jgi:predicted DNA-binding transcriptional regulator AlpA
MSEQKPVYITTRQLRNRYGGVSHMWIERRLADDPTFPKPFYLGARRYWSVAAVEAWERAAAAKQLATS